MGSQRRTRQVDCIEQEDDAGDDEFGRTYGPDQVRQRAGGEHQTQAAQGGEERIREEASSQKGFVR